MIKKLNLLISKSRVRKKENRFVVSGERELTRAVEMGYKVHTLLYRVDYDKKNIKVYSDSIFELSSDLFDRLSKRSGSEESSPYWRLKAITSKIFLSIMTVVFWL